MLPPEPVLWHTPLAASVSSRAAWVVILAGVTAALHVGKLAPALPVLRQSLDMSLVQAGFLLSLVQLAGVGLGVFMGLGIDGLGLRRSMLMGLVLLAFSSALSGHAASVEALLAWRVLEGLGFLLTVMPAPGLIRRHTPAAHLASRLGWWGSYMPVGSALALLVGSWFLQIGPWSFWWWALAFVSALAALAVWVWVPADASEQRSHARPNASAPLHRLWPQALMRIWGSAPVWWVALCFAVYSAQWLAVVGFLPTMTQGLDWSPEWVGVLMAWVALMNGLGNVMAGRWLQRGAAAHHLLWAGFLGMAVGAWLAFDAQWPLAMRWICAVCFSMAGGLIPATLFSTVVRVAPSVGSVSAAVGWMQQLSALGQLTGPPVVAWVAAQAGGWHGTAWVCLVCCAAGCGFAARLRRVEVS